MKKPVKKRGTKALNYHEAIRYIEKKYKIDTGNYKGRKYNGKPDDAEYCDFWHWFIEYRDIHNGCYAHLDIHDALTDRPEYAKFNSPEWVKEIVRLIKKEFAPRSNEITFWVEW